MSIKVRSLDYYLKDMPYDGKRQVLLEMDKINAVMVQQLLEREKDYPTLRSMGFTDNEIQEYVDSSVETFQNVNKAMADNEREPLFQTPEDTFASSQAYVNLLKMKTDEELIEEFGCTIEEYQPKIIKKKLDKGGIEM